MTTVRETVPSPSRMGLDLIAIQPGAEVDLDLRLESVSEGVLVTGTVHAPTRGECARCLTPISGEIEIELTELFAYPDSATESTTEEDEVGHVVEKHHDERITRQMNAQIGVSLLGALLGSGYGQLGSEGAGVYLLRNTREQEAEADVVGQRLMADAGFDPSKAVDLWQNMMAASGARQPQWLSTHPDPENRIRALRNAAPALMPVYAAARQAGRVPRCP